MTPPIVAAVPPLPRSARQSAGLEGEHLALGVERRLDLAHRRRRARGQHQLLGLVEADAGEGGKIEHMRRLQRPAEAALAAAGDELERLLARDRVGDDRLEVARIGGARDGSTLRLKGAAGRETAACRDGHAAGPVRRSDGAAGRPCRD